MPKTASKSPESSGKDATGSPSQHPESTSPADTLISDFKYPEQRTTHFCCLNPPVCGALPWQPQEINIPLTKKFYHTLILLSIFPGFSSHPNPWAWRTKPQSFKGTEWTNMRCTILSIMVMEEDMTYYHSFTRVQLFAMLWTVALQAPLSMGFSRQEYWNGFPCPPPGDLPNPGTEPVSYVSCFGRWVLYH